MPVSNILSKRRLNDTGIAHVMLSKLQRVQTPIKLELSLSYVFFKNKVVIAMVGLEM